MKTAKRLTLTFIADGSGLAFGSISACLEIGSTDDAGFSKPAMKTVTLSPDLQAKAGELFAEALAQTKAQESIE